MIRIAGTNIPADKRIAIALTNIYGIGNSLSLKILHNSKINPDTKSQELDEKSINILRDAVAKEKVEGDLRREVMDNIKRLKDINSYRGVRHFKGLPVRGQRTSTNMRTRKGNKRVTLTSGRRKLEKT
jgi:small subunit ribosomal protein S13